MSYNQDMASQRGVFEIPTSGEKGFDIQISSTRSSTNGQQKMFNITQSNKT